MSHVMQIKTAHIPQGLIEGLARRVLSEDGPLPERAIVRVDYDNAARRWLAVAFVEEEAPPAPRFTINAVEEKVELHGPVLFHHKNPAPAADDYTAKCAAVKQKIEARKAEKVAGREDILNTKPVLVTLAKVHLCGGTVENLYVPTGAKRLYRVQGIWSSRTGPDQYKDADTVHFGAQPGVEVYRLREDGDFHYVPQR